MPDITDSRFKTCDSRSGKDVVHFWGFN